MWVLLAASLFCKENSPSILSKNIDYNIYWLIYYHHYFSYFSPCPHCLDWTSSKSPLLQCRPSSNGQNTVELDSSIHLQIHSLYVLCAVKWQYSFFKFKWHMRHLILLEKNKKLNIAIIEQTITCFGVTPFTNFALIKGYPWTSYRSIQLSSIQPDTGHWWLGPLQTFWINKGAHKMN